jgi:hypothetical protein
MGFVHTADLCSFLVIAVHGSRRRSFWVIRNNGPPVGLFVVSG